MIGVGGSLTGAYSLAVQIGYNNLSGGIIGEVVVGTDNIAGSFNVTGASCTVGSGNLLDSGLWCDICGNNATLSSAGLLYSDNAHIIGNNATITGFDAVVLGNNSTITGNAVVALGAGCTCTITSSENAILLGAGATATSAYSLGIGCNAASIDATGAAAPPATKLLGITVNGTAYRIPLYAA